MRGRAVAVITAVLLAMVCARTQAQLPIHFSVSGGLVLPQGNEEDLYNQGFHAGAALKVILIPLQAEVSYDRLGSRGLGEALSIWALGAAVPVDLTPPLIPLGIYLIAGAGVYHHGGDVDPSSLGINAGAGLRIKPLPTLQPFVEGRGVAIFRDGNRVTYLTVGGGIRF